MPPSKLRSSCLKIMINIRTDTRNGIWCRYCETSNWVKTTPTYIGWGTVSTPSSKHSPTACSLASRSIMKLIIANSSKPNTAYIKSAKNICPWPNRSSWCRISVIHSTPRIWPTTWTKIAYWRNSFKKYIAPILNHSTKFYCPLKN